MIEILTNATLWFPASIALAAIAVVALVARGGGAGRALSLAYGCMIGLMGTGHFVAVTIRAFDGTLSDGITWTLYPIGLALAIPGWWLAASAWRGAPARRLAALNVAIAIALAIMGPAVALAGFAVLAVVHLFVERRFFRHGAVALTVAIYAAMLVMALTGSGRSF